MSLDIYLEPEIDSSDGLGPDLFWRNITHNVTPMWRKAGVYDALYESDGTHAYRWLDVLDAGVRDMQDHPETYEKLNAKNGWGKYEHALPFLVAWRDACREHPRGIIRVSR